MEPTPLSAAMSRSTPKVLNKTALRLALISMRGICRRNRPTTILKNARKVSKALLDNSSIEVSARRLAKFFSGKTKSISVAGEIVRA
jgi:hypothetical protein